MKKLLMLGTSYASCEMIKYAKSQGVYTVVTDYLEPTKSVAKLVADEFWMINTADIDLLEHKCREEGINAVICGISEFNLEVSMELCKRLNLPHYCTPEAWHYSRNKADFKALCRKLGAPVPKDYEISDALTDEELDKVQYPVMCKPVDLSGNRGISYCYSKNDLRQAYKYARSLTKSNKIIVEKMLHGEEWWSGYAISNGDIRLISLNAMYAQPGEPKNCYTITTTLSSHVERFVEEVNPKIEEVLRAVGCKEGYAWVQVMLDDDGHFYIIEMGYRLSGEMIFTTFKEFCNCNIIKMLVDYSLGMETKSQLPQSQKHPYKRIASGIELWTNKSGIIKEYRGIEELRKMPGVLFETLNQIGDSVSQYRPVGCISFCSEDVEDLISMLKKINDSIQVLNEEGEDMVIKYTNFDYLREIYKESIGDKYV